MALGGPVFKNLLTRILSPVDIMTTSWQLYDIMRSRLHRFCDLVRRGRHWLLNPSPYVKSFVFCIRNLPR